MWPVTFIQDWILPRRPYELSVGVAQRLRSTSERKPFGADALKVSPEHAEESSFFQLRVAGPRDCMWVRLDNLRSGTAVTFTPEQHHFVRYLRDGKDSLTRFYDVHQPTNQFEGVFSSCASVGEFEAVRYPFYWHPWTRRSQYFGEAHLGEEHGNPMFGPVTPEKLDYEAKRLDSVLASIEENGFWIRGEDIPRYRLLVDDVGSKAPRYVVFLENANHRVAALSHLGWSLIPMMPQKGQYREVRLSDVEHWPGVVQGVFSTDAATAYFRAFFRDARMPLLQGW